MFMALQRHVVVLLLLACLFTSSYSYQFMVGGKDGWVPNPSENYNTWSQRMRFQINDSVLFKYKQGADSVLEVNKDDYDKCNTGNPIKKMEDGNSIFPFDRSGPFYFISGNKDNCDKGQKLQIIVISVRNQGPSTPAPVAAPPSNGSSTPTTPSPSGGSTTPPPKSSAPSASSPTAAPPTGSSTPGTPATPSPKGSSTPSTPSSPNGAPVSTPAGKTPTSSPTPAGSNVSPPSPATGGSITPSPAGGPTGSIIAPAAGGPSSMSPAAGGPSVFSFPPAIGGPSAGSLAPAAGGPSAGGPPAGSLAPAAGGSSAGEPGSVAEGPGGNTPSDINSPTGAPGNPNSFAEMAFTPSIVFMSVVSLVLTVALGEFIVIAP